MSIILAMDGNYPDIYSGAVSFENTRTGAKILLYLPEDVINGVYGIRSITIDPGASATVLPESFAQRLRVEKPTRDKGEYYVFAGVGGTSVCFYSPDPITVGVGDGNERLENTIMPFFLVVCAPSITSEGRLLAKPDYHPYTEEIIHFISPPFRPIDDYTVEVCSPSEKFLALNRRLKLEVDIGREMDYILIGRDWQEEFELTFEAERIIIGEKRQSGSS